MEETSYMNVRPFWHSRKTVLILVALFVVGLLLVIFSFSQSSRNSDRDVGVGPEYVEANGPALLSNSASLYRMIDDAEQFSALTQDIASFARSTLNYSEADEVLFEVTSSESTDGAVRIEGVFTRTGETIQANVELKPYSQIYVVFSLDGQEYVDTPSNSSRNQFIASLPINRSNYYIDYTEASGFFTITLYTNSATARQAAINEIEKGIGEKLENNQYSVFVPPSAGAGIGE
jgi:cell division protein FtsB